MTFSLKQLLIFITGIQLFLVVVFSFPPIVCEYGPSHIAKAQVKEFMHALELYKLKTRRDPSTSEGLKALTKWIGDSSGPLMEAIPKDPWGNEYEYRRKGLRYEIICYGADGEPGGKGSDADIMTSDIRKGRY